jgi:hypothetical protein
MKTAKWETFKKDVAETLENGDQPLDNQYITEAIRDCAGKKHQKTSKTIPKKGLKWITLTVREKIQLLGRKAEIKYKQTPNQGPSIAY